MVLVETLAGDDAASLTRRAAPAGPSGGACSVMGRSAGPEAGPRVAMISFQVLASSVRVSERWEAPAGVFIGKKTSCCNLNSRLRPGLWSGPSRPGLAALTGPLRALMAGVPCDRAGASTLDRDRLSRRACSEGVRDHHIIGY